MPLTGECQVKQKHWNIHTHANWTLQALRENLLRALSLSSDSVRWQGGTLFSVPCAGVCATPRVSPPSAPCCATQQTPAAWRQTAAPRPPLSHSPLRSQDPPWPHPSATSPRWPRPVPTPPSPPSTPLGCLGSVSALFWPDSQCWVGYSYTLGNKVRGVYQNRCLSLFCWGGGRLFVYPG